MPRCLAAPKSAGPPVFRRELLKPFKISTVDIARRLRSLLHQLVQISSEHGANGVKRVMAAQPLSLQAGERLDHDVLPKCQLVLDHDVNDCVERNSSCRSRWVSFLARRRNERRGGRGKRSRTPTVPVLATTGQNRAS